MVGKILSDKLISLKNDYDIFVLKGFPLNVIEHCGDDFLWIDSYVVADGNICLDRLNGNQLLTSILFLEHNKKAICTIESLISLCNQMQGLSVLGKKLCVVENNMLRYYPNPTNLRVPDFDSIDSQDDNGNPAYSDIFSFCEITDGIEYVEYVDNYSIDNSDVLARIPFIPIETKCVPKKVADSKYPIISTKDDFIWDLLSAIYNGKPIESNAFGVREEDAQDDLFAVLVNASKVFNRSIEFEIVEDYSNPQPRQELYDILSDVWGYPDFRQLKIYRNLFHDRELISVSQGSIIETVVNQAEKALDDKRSDVNNILLTSPTGAGKSLLFQTSAIYLAEKYGLLTIVVSPLVALMEDQVNGLENYPKVASINSNKSAAEKRSILEGIQNGDINILYLSPELLLSYSITTFLGKRRLGLLVIDEAHTVTTWGRDFRVDYWFLGDYIRTAKKILNYNFPIFALTATAVWDPNGHNDMVFDTISSLNMSPCLKYIGAVKRDNIVFDIQQSDITTKYEENRRNLTLQRIREVIVDNKKTIVYFPFRRIVENICECEEAEDIRNRMAEYHARLPKVQKSQNSEAFKSGEKIVMCATKAFGMGIDVPDIQVVYHHAPTGCLSDYVQEIGRLARDPRLIGTAKIDFNTNDFRYIRQLHGLSAIKPYQLFQVLKRLLDLFTLNGEHRNMLISPDDFAYIFPLSKPEEIEQNVKSCLLLISHDLKNKLGFHALIVRPKSLFSKCFLELASDQQSAFHRFYRNYLKKINDRHFILDAEKFWNDYYSNLSFPSFKYKLASGNVFGGYNARLVTKFSLNLIHSVEETKKRVRRFFDNANRFLTEMANTHHRLAFNKIIEDLPKDQSKEEKEAFLQTFHLLYATDKCYASDGVEICRVYTSIKEKSGNNSSFQLMNNGFERIGGIYQSAFEKLINNEEMTTFCSEKDIFSYLADFLSSLNLATYDRQGGEKPSVFIRINNPFYLKNLIRKGKYENAILNGIYEKYRFSEKVFTYFFTTPMSDAERWQFIEDYFLGVPENELLKI